jgi:DNA-binding transcriptional MerR regulator
MKSTQDATALAPALETPEIPDKLYFRIGEVARLAGIKPYVLRFWETEFPGLGPRKSDTGHRLYRRKDVETVLEIKRLLYDQRFTIEGARKFLEARSKAGPRASDKPAVKPPEKRRRQGELFDEVGTKIEPLRQELREILKILK